MKFLLSLGLCSLLMLAGCALQPTAPSTAEPQALRGTVHGGQAPVTGARVFVLQAARTAYGATSVDTIGPTHSLLKDATYNAYYTTTDVNGSFLLTGQYTCTANAQIYVLATQGNPGLGAGKSNPALAELAALGTCPAAGTFSPSLNIVVTEATTVAAV